MQSVKAAVLAQYNQPLEIREYPVPASLQPGEARVLLADPTDFAKFMHGGEAIDVPEPEDAAGYVPGGGAGGDQQAAYAAGWDAGYLQAQSDAKLAVGDLEPPPAPPYGG